MEQKINGRGGRTFYRGLEPCIPRIFSNLKARKCYFCFEFSSFFGGGGERGIFIFGILEKRQIKFVNYSNNIHTKIT